jgi:ribosomal protein L32
MQNRKFSRSKNRQRKEGIKMQVIRNRAKCKRCGDIIESKHSHDFVSCKCKAIALDGGTDYQRIIGNPEDFDFSLSEYIFENEEERKRIEG